MSLRKPVMLLHVYVMCNHWYYVLRIYGGDTYIYEYVVFLTQITQ